jgi:hypothetical protein
LSKIFNKNAVKGRQRSSLSLCNVSKTPTAPFQILIHLWEQKKISRSDVGREEVGTKHTILLWAKKGGIFLTLQRFNENRWRPLAAFSLKILDNVSSSGSGIGIAASSHGGGDYQYSKTKNALFIQFIKN